MLVVGINYAPEHAGIAPYTTDAAEHFAAQGHDVRVLAGLEHYPSWSVPRDMRFRPRRVETRNGVELTRLRHHVPRRQWAPQRAMYEATFGAHVAVAGNWPADVVIAVVPSLLGAAAARRLARRVGAPFGVWVQDLMGLAAAQSGMTGGRALARTTARIERSLLRDADAVAIVSEAFRPHVRAAGTSDDRIVFMPNWVHVDESQARREDTRRALGWQPDEVVALHTGNMGLKQGLENVVGAARLAEREGSGPRVRFVLMGEGHQRDRLARLSADCSSVSLVPPAAPDSYPDVLAAADVLVLNERAGVLDMSLPSKLTSYFAAGRPVVAATHADGGTGELVRRAEAGRVVEPGDPGELLRAVRDIATDASAAETAGRCARAYAESTLSQHAGLARCDEFLDRLRRSAPVPYPD